MKRLATLLLAVLTAGAAAFGFAGCNKDGGAAYAAADGKLTIGYTIYAPMNYFDDNNNLVGFDTELAQAFCTQLGLEAEFVEINWNNKFTELESGNIDCIWNGMTITDEVKEKTAVSEPYLENKQVVVCPADRASDFQSVADIEKASSVAFESGSAGEQAVEDLDIEKIGVAAQRNALIEVAAGTSDIAVVDLTMARVLTGAGTSYENLTYVDVGFAAEEFGVAFRKSDAVLAKTFDMFIALSKTAALDNLFDTLSAKYFG